LLARLALRFVTYATVRDKRSVEALSALGISRERIKLTADEGWTYDPKIPPTSPLDESRARGELVVAVNLMPFQVVANAFWSTARRGLDAEEVNEQVLSVILASFESLTPGRMRLVLLPMSSGDAQICSTLRVLLHQRVPCEVASDLDSQYRALARSHLLIGMRMHTIMMAAQTKVPSVAIGVLPKLFETMRDIGLPEYAIETLQLESSAFQDTLNRALQNADITRALLNQRVNGLRETASVNAKVVRALLAVHEH
jgi:polysaccharide pyruvyl transferase WcaK-like protein